MDTIGSSIRLPSIPKGHLPLYPIPSAARQVTARDSPEQLWCVPVHMSHCMAKLLCTPASVHITNCTPSCTCCLQIRDMTAEELLDHMYFIVATKLDNILWSGTLMVDLASAPAAKDITLQAAQQLLESTLGLCSARGPSVGFELCLNAIIKLPSLRTLSTPAVETLLLLAMNNGVPMQSLLEMLSTLPAVGQLNLQQLKTLLEAAVPAAVQHRQISSSNYMLQDDAVSYVSILVACFPQAYHFGPQSWRKLVQLYKSAINSLKSRTYNCPVFHHLVRLDEFKLAAAAVPPESAFELCQLAAGICNSGTTKFHPEAVAMFLGGMFSLPAARQIMVEGRASFCFASLIAAATAGSSEQQDPGGVA